ncbi:hypothetical protein OIU85_005042 [Salix viminalis]|uniref:LysM domain-containing protein n=1 Tax=Salix viminalis TaxID=40686 RepID=A0A9Q0PUK4_SALVM|nr:hypothetical protein OIU85_005042 [Salix viminalis]
MDSHVLLEAFTCRDTVIMIFRKLGARDLARASCVCKLWRDMASGDEIVRPAFMEPWKLKEIVGKPESGKFWRDSGICKFAISHKIVKGDSVASLAVKYSVQVMEIKRLNNMMSDHGIYSRERLLIPIINPNLLINETCYIELDTYANREVAVLYPEGKPDEKLMSKGSSSDHGKRRVIDSLKRSMQNFHQTSGGRGMEGWASRKCENAVHLRSTTLNQIPSIYASVVPYAVTNCHSFGLPFLYRVMIAQASYALDPTTEFVILDLDLPSASIGRGKSRNRAEQSNQLIFYLVKELMVAY